MSWRIPGSAKHNYPTRTIFFQCTALITTLFALLLSNACSGFSTPAASSTTTNPPVTNPTPSLTISSTLPSATVGSPYDSTLTVTGGTAPYSFSLKSGALPAGLLLASTTGTISGTPTATGNFSFAILVSDSKEISKQQSLQITVASAPVTTPPVTTPPGKTFPNLQQSGGWTGYGLTPPSYATCSPSSCDGIIYSMSQGVASPSMSGNSTQFSLSGTTVYADALFNNHLIGDFSSQGLPDNNHTLVPTYHNFTYDVYFYGTNLALSQALEFDINQFFDNQGFIWGHECRIAGGHEWDIWDNVNQHWVPTGIACNPNSNSWNHLTIQVQRTSDNQLLFQSITLNGVTDT
ncbi:MAG: Ig domain-containing protein, partial [Candidatus Sulfotelmatobacter sp.]